MARKESRFKITGTRQLVMHSSALADPLNPIAKALKKVTSKRSKTEADYEEVARLEYLGGLWLSNGKPCIPSTVLEAVFIEGAKKSRRGPAARAGILVPHDAPLHYSGPTDPEQLWADPSFRLVASVRVNQARVMRTRPIFSDWSAEFAVEYLDDLLDEAEIKQILGTAGYQIGVGDWRPKFGLFTVE